MSRNVVSPAYEEGMRRLNDRQRQAVEAIEGPVMVLAGPGTGKTQVLAMRVAHILQRTQMRPSNVLCLTYSSAGAVAMRERLRMLIGADAYGVTVDTVHGFADGIIQRHPSAFEDMSAGKPLVDLRRYRLMKELIDEVSATSPLINPKDPYDRIPQIITRISECKREGKTLEDLLRVADLYDVEMAEKSRPGTKAHEKNLLQARKFRAFVDLFRRYGERLNEERLYDYDDMILVVIRALSEEPWILQSLQERFQYLLVDEAQDLNGAQWRVIELLTTLSSVPFDPNFFLVGDDDQSIYRFQGANMAHLLRFRERFPQAPMIVLTENYRSTQSILDAAGRLIAHSDERLIDLLPGLSKDLHAHAGDIGDPPTLLRPPSDDAELWVIADLCKDRIDAGIPPDEIAILVQTNAELFPIYDTLQARSIPAVLHGKSDLLVHPVVRQALTILRAADGGEAGAFDHALAAPCFGIHPADLARLASAAWAEKSSVEQIVIAKDLATLGIAHPQVVLQARDIVLDLRHRRAARTLLDTVETALRASGLISAAVASRDPLDLAAIEAFFQYVKTRTLSHPFLELDAFLDDLRLYADEAFAQLRLTYRVPHLVASGVQLLTAHQSKGLEFHTVILSSFRGKHWDERTPPHGLAVPEELLFGWEPERLRREKHHDERRVAYVAMTRAKRELLFLCPKEFAVGERPRPVEPSSFFAEAGPLPERDQAVRYPAQSSSLLHQPKRDIDQELAAYIRTQLDDFALTPSSLQTFLLDPQEFLRVHLLRQPEYRDESSQRTLAYGSAVHWALRQWAMARKEGKELSQEAFLSEFLWYLQERTILTKKQVADLTAQATLDLPRYFSSKLAGSSPLIFAAERQYRARLGEIPIKGKIDRIDLVSEHSGDLIVIDFKTGHPKTLATIRAGTEPDTVSRTSEGENFRQLVFYALLLEHAEPTYVPRSFRLEFIGNRSDDPVTREFEVSESEKTSLRSLLNDVWTKILALDFTKL